MPGWCFKNCKSNFAKVTAMGRFFSRLTGIVFNAVTGK
jgi:hypothetical protein